MIEKWKSYKKNWIYSTNSLKQHYKHQQHQS